MGISRLSTHYTQERDDLIILDTHVFCINAIQTGVSITFTESALGAPTPTTCMQMAY